MFIGMKSLVKSDAMGKTVQTHRVMPCQRIIDVISQQSSLFGNMLLLKQDSKMSDSESQTSQGQTSQGQNHMKN